MLARTVAVVIAAASLSAACLAAAPSVAVVYSSWPDGKYSFREEFDDELAQLGWEYETVENTEVASLVERLDDVDMVVAAGVANYEHTQDMGRWREQWLSFLRSGGVLLITDASYGSVLDEWVNTLGEDFALTSRQCVSHTDPGPESREITVADHPLMTVPNDLAPTLRARTSWAHLHTWGDEWTSLVECADGHSYLLMRPVGRGLLVVTSYFRFMGGSPDPGAALLENTWVYGSHRRHGLEVTDLDFGTIAPGRSRASVSLRNLREEPVDLRGRVVFAPADGECAPGASRAITLPPHAHGVLELPWAVTARGEATLRLLIEDGSGQAVVDWDRAVSVAPAVQARLTRKHLYPRHEELVADVSLLPHQQAAPERLRLQVAIDDTEPDVLPGDRSRRTLRLPAADLEPGEHTLRLRLTERDRGVQGEASVQFFVHDAPVVGLREDGVTLVRGDPFFPFGFYHVSQSFDAEHRLQMVRDIAEAGFNAAHVRAMDIDRYGPFLDECAGLGVHIVTEFTAPRLQTIERYRDHPAVLAWNPGDEPSIHGHSGDVMFARYDEMKQLDPDHLTYLVICRPDQFGHYVSGTDVLAPDPYPVPRRSVAVVYDTLSRARREGEPWGTSVWGVLQCFGGYGSWERPPTPEELRAMTFLALIARVRGIVYYTYADGSFEVTDHPELWQAARSLVPQIEMLTPALTDGEFELLAEDADGVYAAAWTHDDEGFVLAVNTADETREVSLAAPGAELTTPFDDADLSLIDGRVVGSLPPLGTVLARTQID